MEKYRKRDSSGQSFVLHKGTRDEKNEQLLLIHIKIRDGTLEQNTVSQVGNQEHLYEHYQ